MFEKMPIRLRLTVLTMSLLTACCLGLTITLNLSAVRMADTIESIPTIAAIQVGANAAIYPPPQTLQPDLSVQSQTARSTFLYQSILYAVLAVSAGGALTYALIGKALKPLQELRRQMNYRTVHNLSENMPLPESHDEIAALTHSFNEMSNKLSDAFAMQKRFSQSAAHELRTPLTVIKTKVDVFKKKKDHNPEDYDKLLSVISSHTDRLANLIKDLLNLTHMDALPSTEPIELKGMLAEIAEELSSLTKTNHIVLTIQGEAYTVLGNQSLLHRAFYNIVENAINYNTENGKVTISIASQLEKCIITIEDTGIGIPDELRELIFEPFYRVDKSRSRQLGSTGLGLPTVKAIIDQHHGQISLTANPNGGTIFKITL